MKIFAKDPQTTLTLLELLKDDSELYVRRSVANHLGDLLKDHPEVVYTCCDRWLSEVSAKKIPTEQRKQRHWIIRHAVRLPAKKQESRALALRRQAQ